MEQAQGYVGMLERINAVGMAAQLLESMEESDPKERDTAKAELARRLLKMYRQGPRTIGKRVGRLAK
jgi:hypothetical protein